MSSNNISNLRSKITAVADAVRSKTGTTDELTLDEMAVTITNIKTNPVLQDKTLTANGEYTPDEGYYGLSKVIVNVPTSSGGGTGGGSSVGTTDITDGFTARFFDENNNILQVTRVRNGLWLDKPQYECDSWQNTTGYINSFPLLLEGDADFYAHLVEYCSQVLYTRYGLSRTDYPYILMVVQQDSGKTYTYYTVYFTATEPYVTSSGWGVSSGKRARYNPSGNLGTDMVTATQYVIQNALEVEDSDAYSMSRDTYKVYGNFDNSTLDGRLDQTVYVTQ